MAIATALFHFNFTVTVPLMQLSVCVLRVWGGCGERRVGVTTSATLA